MVSNIMKTEKENNMKTLIRTGTFIILMGLIISIQSCSVDNDTITGLSENPMVQAIAKWMGFNLNKDSRLKGVFEITLKGTQAFDASYYGWPEGGLSGYGTISTLRDENKTVGQYYNYASFMGGAETKSFMGSATGIQHPHPNNILEDISVYTPFADGSFPDQRPYFSGACPIFLQTCKSEWYDKGGNVVEDTTTNHTVTYENELPSTQTIVFSDGTKRVYTYAMDPFGGSYYQNSGSFYDAEENITSSYTTTRTRTQSGSVITDMTISVSKNADNDVITRIIETWVRNASEKTETSTFSNYNNENDDSEFYRAVILIIYDNYPLRQYKSADRKEYSFAGGEETLETHKKVEFENGFPVKETEHDPDTETITQTKNYEKDAQGREVEYTRENSEGNVEYCRISTFDSIGRIASKTYYNVNIEGTQTCSQNKKEYSYSTDSTGNKVFTTTYYLCDEGEISQSPIIKNVFAYNQKGLLVQYQRYNYIDVDETFILQNQTTSEYDSNGAMAQTIEWEVEDGVAEENRTTTYEYDQNLFQTVEKRYDSEGELSSLSSGVACEIGIKCFETHTYTYY